MFFIGEDSLCITLKKRSWFMPQSKEELLRIMDETDRKLVGRAFFEVLVSAIPRGIRSLIELCQDKICRVSLKKQMRLAEEPDVKSGGQPAIELAAFGFTPIHIVLATDAVGLLLERAIDAGFFSVGKKLFINRLPVSGENMVICEERIDGLSQSDLIDEISARAEIDIKKSSVLLQWAIETAKFIPYLFIGFRVDLIEGKLVLIKLTRSEMPTNLFQRWRFRI